MPFHTAFIVLYVVSLPFLTDRRPLGVGIMQNDGFISSIAWTQVLCWGTGDHSPSSNLPSTSCGALGLTLLIQKVEKLYNVHL